MAAENSQKSTKLLVASNRLPVSIKRVGEGKYEVGQASGGLVTSLSGLSESTRFQWFGSPGIEVPENEKDHVKKLMAERDAVPVFLDQQLASDHYNGFSNSVLWPILHYQSARVDFDENWWEAYKKVNEQFAKSIAEVAEDGDLIWLHDYHLLLVPKLLRTELANRSKTAKIGYSLHTPFPAPEIYRTLASSREILEGMLNSDLLGFHTDNYADHFLQACKTIMGLPRVENTIHFNDRVVHAKTFVVGINPEKFQDILRSDAVRRRITDLNDRYAGLKRIVGVDRLDYIKGLPQKMRGFEQFLCEHPEWVGEIILIQIAVPSREEVPDYQDLLAEVEQLVGKINGNFGRPDYAPIVFVHNSVSVQELTALYATSDLCLLTSTRDGMNLVASEYMACQGERQGVLAVSEFAGIAAYFQSAIQFNPLNKHEISNAIYSAVTMDDSTRKQHYQNLIEYIKRHTSVHWGKTFVDNLAATNN